MTSEEIKKEIIEKMLAAKNNSVNDQYVSDFLTESILRYAIKFREEKTLEDFSNTQWEFYPRQSIVDSTKALALDAALSIWTKNQGDYFMLTGAGYKITFIDFVHSIHQWLVKK